MNQEHDPNVDAFNHDIANNEGYLYSTNASLSSQMANRRMTDAALESTDFQGKRVVDVGAGDGTYTLELYDRGQPACIYGVDMAQEAIRIAQERVGDRQIVYEVNSAYALPCEASSFDITHLRGVLHHMDRPADALKEGLRVSSSMVVIEPNGYNPVLKLLERFSRYHIEHREKSYSARQLRRWVMDAGGRVVHQKFIGLVPMFCPDWFARIMKFIEPVAERIPLINVCGCAQVVIVAVRVAQEK